MTSQAPFPGLRVSKSEGRSYPTIGSVYAWELEITIKHLSLLYEHTIESPSTVRSRN